MQLPEPRNLAAAVLSGLVLTASAQETNTEPDVLRLVELKREFERNIRSDIAPASRQYVAELKRLEKKFADSGALESAIEARDQRLALEKFLGDALVVKTEPPKATPETNRPPNEDGAIELPDTAADISGGAKFTDNGLDLSADGATARWKLAGIEPGGYEVELTYVATGGSKLRVGEDFFRITTDLPATGGDGSCKALGNLKITSNADSLYLTNLGPASGSGKVLIQSILLMSASE